MNAKPEHIILRCDWCGTFDVALDELPKLLGTVCADRAACEQRRDPLRALRTTSLPPKEEP